MPQRAALVAHREGCLRHEASRASFVAHIPPDPSERVMAASKNLTPEQRIERARKAGAASHGPDRYIKALVRRASQLTEAHRDQLRDLLQGTRGQR